MEEESLIHCAYASVEAIEFSEEEIVALLEQARTGNKKLGITGMLLYDNGAFFQVLEGELEVVARLLEKIEKDPRHERFIKIIQEDIEARDFSEWTMGYSGIKSSDLKGIEGLNDFFGSGKRYIDLDKGRAKTLLKGFKEGRWRGAIN